MNIINISVYCTNLMTKFFIACKVKLPSNKFSSIKLKDKSKSSTMLSTVWYHIHPLVSQPFKFILCNKQSHLKTQFILNIQLLHILCTYYGKFLSYLATTQLGHVLLSKLHCNSRVTPTTNNHQFYSRGQEVFDEKFTFFCRSIALELLKLLSKLWPLLNLVVIWQHLLKNNCRPI